MIPREYRKPKYVSVEDCDRLDVPVLLADAPATEEEKARNFAVRFAYGQRFALIRKSRWQGRPWWHLICPRCLAHREYLLRLPGSRPEAFGCRGCLPVMRRCRRYRPTSPSRRRGTPMYRTAVRQERERQRAESLAFVTDARRERAEADEARREKNTQLAQAMIRVVAELGSVEVPSPLETAPPSAARLRAMVRAIRQRRNSVQGLAAQETARTVGTFRG